MPGTRIGFFSLSLSVSSSGTWRIMASEMERGGIEKVHFINNIDNKTHSTVPLVRRLIS